MDDCTKSTIEQLKKEYKNLLVLGSFSFNWGGSGTAMSEHKEITMCCSNTTFFKIIYTYDTYYEGDWSDSSGSVLVFKCNEDMDAIEQLPYGYEF